MKPVSLKEFYPDKYYGQQRDLDAHYAEKILGFHKVKLPSLRNRESGKVGVPPLQYNWFWSPKEVPNLNYVISPDAMVPNLTTNFDDTIKIAKAIGITHLAVATIGNMLHYILTQADKYENKFS